MFTKINFLQIIRDHLLTLRHYQGDGKVAKGDIFLFFVLPGFLSIGFYWGLGLSLNSDLISILITSLSIFAALLFNLLILIYDIITKQKNSAQQDSKRVKRFLQEIYANVSYSILISVVDVVILLGGLFKSPPWIVAFVNLGSFYLVIHFVLTLLMILKRVHVLLALEFRAE